MEFKRVKVGAIVKNKVNAKTYLVMDCAGTAIEMDELGPIENGDRVTITEKNCICFRTIRDAEPTVPEGYTAVKGILMKDGSPVTQQGSIEVLNVLYSFINGQLLLVVKTAKLAGMKALYLYNPERDSFYDLGVTTYEEEDIDVMYQNPDNTDIYLRSLLIKDKVVKNGDDEEIISVIEDYGVIELFASTSKAPVDIKIINNAEGDDGIILDAILKPVESANNSVLYGRYSKSFEWNEDDSICRVQDLGKEGVVVITNGYISNIPAVCEIGEDIRVVRSDFLSETVILTQDRVIIAGKTVLEKSDAVAKLIKSGCSILIDVARDDKTTTYIFADKAYTTFGVKVINTKDRGRLYEVV